MKLFFFFPPFTPPPLFTPAGVKRGAWICFLESSHGITSEKPPLRLEAQDFKRSGRRAEVTRCRGTARGSASARTKLVSTTASLEISRFQKQSQPPACNSVFGERSKIRRPLSTPAGVERGRGEIGGEIQKALRLAPHCGKKK